MKKSRPEQRKINGYHATWMFVAFFGVIFAVNMLMARMAISTFGGTVVDNSYVASQQYNKWLDEGRKQAAHGWEFSRATRTGDRIIFSASAQDSSPLGGLQMTGVVAHPVGQAEMFNLTFAEIAPGTYRSEQALPAGRWKLKLRAARGEQAYSFLDEVQ